MPRRSLVFTGPAIAVCLVSEMAKRSYQWSELPHLARRTVWSFRKPAPDAAGEMWLRSLLSPAEYLLYRSMSAADRAHAVMCARAVEDLGAEVAVASALHDVGKTQAGLDTIGRVSATLCGLVMADRARSWVGVRGVRGQIAIYLDHTERGASLLSQAGASEMAVTWGARTSLSVGNAHTSSRSRRETRQSRRIVARPTR